MMNILVEGRTPTTLATKTDLNAWVTAAKAPFTVTLDSDPTSMQPGMETYFNVGRDQQIIVDLSTMQILQMFDTDMQGALVFFSQKLAGM